MRFSADRSVSREHPELVLGSTCYTAELDQNSIAGRLGDPSVVHLDLGSVNSL
jgi:hypothetical protein